ncbi:hypothetical protein D0544_06350 [Aestuariirhabdus litorea]|uniref:Replication-associated protein G2P C-terminal domain-containing protein n=1 Tax=Aestuariirhabdus litorea TaxID=2528527 RepID=A0A3P3VTC0_9GAMM|nr:hypothetical protein D0544_06350 [Aestuariirhabdus litorea]RWW97944.1 hypothetical protein DZC74_06345 [Endozoicomonadaceae bacterium GTF-13]
MPWQLWLCWANSACPRRSWLEHGFDIALRQESVDRSNVVPLIRILEAQPVSVPSWAFDQQLVHPSARH